MRGWFADTSYFLALLNRHDAAHRRATELTLELEGKLVTTPWVVVEVANAISASRRRGVFAGLLEGLRHDERSLMVPLDEDAFDRGIALYDARRDKLWSLTDCISFVVMEAQGLR